jgi:hypothetical protein
MFLYSSSFSSIFSSFLLSCFSSCFDSFFTALGIFHILSAKNLTLCSTKFFDKNNHLTIIQDITEKIIKIIDSSPDIYLNSHIKDARENTMKNQNNIDINQAKRFSSLNIICF